MLTATKSLVGGACAAPSPARRRTFVVPEARRKPGNGRRTSVSKVGSTSTTTTTTTTLSSDSNGTAVGTVTRPDAHVRDRTQTTEMKATVTVHMSKAAGVRDFLYDLILKTWLHVDLVSSELDPQTGQEWEPISGAVKHSGRVDDEWDMYEATFKVPGSFGPIGAVQVTNYHHSEMLLGDIEVFPTGQEESAVTFHCNSWIDPSHCTPDKRVFFPARSYLPSQTPKGVEALRKRELEILRGTGCGERKEHDRIYDYDVYNDLGNPDDEKNPTTRPVLGGKEHPYPRRCRTGRPRSKKDPFSEERSHKDHIYVPRDEAFTERKMGAFDTKKFMSQLHALTTGIKTAKHKDQSFPSLSAIDKLYDDNFRNQPVQPEGGKLRFVIDLLETELLHLFKLEGAAFLEGIRRVFKFETPEIHDRDKFAWFRDEEFARQTIAGMNPLSIQLVTVYNYVAIVPFSLHFQGKENYSLIVLPISI
ncbi:unnamed protein product [Triticum turgidum subsp. durum]|uniref:Lipoxygenase n=1 Tax=Triticum turgidum subsp. durum TaxID=4567 RepID=A0A9R0TE77_TRITD|nr:unnamed protein product [Triticum turgidum subsp. durum]